MGLEVTSPPLDLFDASHLKALYHTSEVYPFVMQHKSNLEKTFPNDSDDDIHEKNMTSFNRWLQKHLANGSTESHLTWLARGPSHTVHKWQAYDINGYTLYTQDRDSKTNYQNSVVRIEAYNGNVKEFYYGIIEEIWELDYVKFKIPLLKCRWVELDHVVVDDYGWTYVDLNRMSSMNDPFILANQAIQIFYVKDLAHPNRHVVMHGKRRIVGVQNVVDEDEYNQFDDLPPIGVRVLETEDMLIPDETCYLHEDHCEFQLAEFVESLIM